MQADWLVLDPNVHGGVYLSGDLNDVMNAIMSSHLGSAHPSYRVEGMIYARTISSSIVNLYYFDGTSGVLLGEVNKTSHTFTPEGVPTAVAPGVIAPYAGSSTPPAGWLLCYGQGVSRTTYAALFAVIGTVYGEGNGTTTFEVPDLRGRTIAGIDNMGGTAAGRLTSTTISPSGNTRGGVGGAQTHTLNTNQIPSHSHVMDARANSDTDFGTQLSVAKSNTQGTASDFSTHVAGGGDPHTNVQPTMVMNYIIKT